MFLQLSVILFTGGSCVAKGGHVWQGSTTGGVRGGGGEHVWQGGMLAGETATEASGTHPIGMRSCSLNVFFDVFD